MTGDGNKSPNLERLASETANYFMAMSQEPGVVVTEEGKFYSQASTTTLASDEIVSNLSPADKVGVLAELVASDEEHGLYLDMVFYGTEVTYKEVIDTLLTKVLSSKISKIPEILKRESENLDNHGEFRWPIE